MSDGEFVWGPLLPLLSDHFECFAMTTRTRLSGSAADCRPERLVEDAAAFVDSIGEPVRLVGWPQGGYVALGSVESISAVSAVAVYEPLVMQAMSQEVAQTAFGTIAEVGALAAEGDLEAAARRFMGWIGNDDELDDADALGFFAGWAPNVPGFLHEMQQSSDSAAPSATDPTELAKITVPLLLLHGTRSNPFDWWIGGVRHVADHVADAQVHRLEGAGHFGPMSEPAAVADQLVRFLAGEPAARQ